MANAEIAQTELVLNYIKENGSITQKDAYREFDCTRLAAKIFILRKRGYPIKSTLEKSRNRYGKTICYARYSL